MHSGKWDQRSLSGMDGGLMNLDVPLHSTSWHRMGEREETEGIKSLAKNDKLWLEVIVQMIWSSLLLLLPNLSHTLSKVISPDF